MNIKFINFGVFLFTIIMLCSCSTPIDSAYDLKNKAANSIAAGTGIRCPWNQLAPLNVLRIYKKTQLGNKTFFEPYSVALIRADKNNSVSCLESNYPQNSWNYTVKGSASIKAQLGYLGLEGAINSKNTKKITAIPQGWFFHKFSWVEGCIFGYLGLKILV